MSHSQISMIHPEAVTSCNVDLENLISDTNRSIATLAITTLLKVCLLIVTQIIEFCIPVILNVSHVVECSLLELWHLFSNDVESHFPPPSRRAARRA